MNAPALYERCRPRQPPGRWLRWDEDDAIHTYVPSDPDYARHWHLEGPCGPEDRHE